MSSVAGTTSTGEVGVMLYRGGRDGKAGSPSPAMSFWIAVPSSFNRPHMD